MLLVHVDNIMIVSHLGDQEEKLTGNFYKIKYGTQVPPAQYLGVDTEKIHTKDVRKIWKTSSSSYITNSIETIKGLILDVGKYKALN